MSRWWLFTSGTAVVGAESSLMGEVFSGQFAEAAADGAEQAELARARGTRTKHLRRRSPCVVRLDHAPSGPVRGRPKRPLPTVCAGATDVAGGAGPTLVIMKWERKWEPVLLSQAPSRFVLLGPAPCDLR